MTECSVNDIPTPAIIYDLAVLREDLDAARRICDLAESHLLFSLKACYLRAVLDVIRTTVRGYSASSLFEARFAAEVRSDDQTIHITAPAVRSHEIGELTTIVEKHQPSRGP